MEPDVSDQYDSVSEFMAHLLVMRLNQEQHEQVEAREKRQVNCRLPQHAYTKLAELAAEVGETPTSLAAALLELAVYEADGVQLVPDNEASAGTEK